MSARKVMLGLGVALVAVMALAMTSIGSANTAKSEATPIRVAIVTDIGGLDDKGFNMLANRGLQRAKKELGVEGRVYISKSNSDYIPNLVAATTRYKANVVVAIGFLMGDALAAVAKRYPKTKFAIVDYPHAALKGKPANARGLIFAENEAGYLVGVAAAFANKSGTVSGVGGQSVPAVDAFLAGYRAGARKQKRAIKVLTGYSQEFVDQAKCKELALNQIEQGSDAVFAAAGQCGLGALSAARERSVWGIGVDADQGYIGTHILTSATKKVDLAVFKTAEAVKKGTFKGGGDTLYNVKNGGVGYGRLSTRAPAGLQTRLKAIATQIKNGTIKNIPKKL